MIEAPYPAFPSIPRLLRDVVITEKLDGTNALIQITEEGVVRAGSRNRWITPESDNYGFATWVRDHENELRALGPGCHYGEWWGRGIQAGYGLPDRRFSLFNTGRWTCDGNTDYHPLRGDIQFMCQEVPCCYVVPLLTVRTFNTDVITAYLQELKANGSFAAPGFMNPEGIVVFHTKSRHTYKVTLHGKDGHKGNG